MISNHKKSRPICGFKSTQYIVLIGKHRVEPPDAPQPVAIPITPEIKRSLP